MDMQANMAFLLEGLGNRIGLDLTAPDLSGNYFCLSVDKTRVLNMILVPERRSCILHMEFHKPAACLATHDPAELTRRLAFLLGANVMLMGAGGAALGYEEESGTVSMSMSCDIPENVDEAAQTEFSLRVEGFLETFGRWTQYVESVPAATAEGMPGALRI